MTDRPPSVRGRALAWSGWAAFAVIVAVGVPIFVRMPLWIDATLYQVAAAEVLWGGVLYRDVFDTNLPGFVALLTVVQAAFGPNPAAVRAADLVIVGTTLLVLARWARACGGSAGAVAWACAGAAWFYLAASEFCHCQRDTWMLLPAAAAAWRRVRRLSRDRDGRAEAFADGVLWGVAVWIKPHVVVPALAVWAVSLPYAFRAWGWRGVVRDTVGLLAGGLLMGAAGVGLLVLSGAWAPFLDVMFEWNPKYLDNTLNGVSDRAWWTFRYFTPWSLLHFLALPLAVVNVAEAVLPGRGWRLVRWVYPPGAGPSARAARLVLAAFYLGWAGQALVIQRHFHYAHVPETLVALALLAGQGWALGLACVAWLAGLGVLLNVAAENPRVRDWTVANDPHTIYLPVQMSSLANPNTLARWPACFGPTTPELWDALARDGFAGPAPGWADLRRVADHLRAAGAGDGDVAAFHDSTHPVYLLLGVRPGTRFMHFTTAFEVDGGAGRVVADLRDRRFRYVVSDLRKITGSLDKPAAPGRPGPHDLPAWVPASERAKFPWDQPVVFRSGRYCVHRMAHPVGAVLFADPTELDKQGPGFP